MSDIEKMIGGDYAQLTNTNIRSFGWKGVTVTVKDRQTQQPKTILNDINGIVKAGELLALMGPSYVDRSFHHRAHVTVADLIRTVVPGNRPSSTSSHTAPPR